jgi:twinkle protein
MKTSCDNCGSSDGRHIYPDGGEHCFVCQDHKHADQGDANMEVDLQPNTGEFDRLVKAWATNAPFAVPDRSIRPEQTKFYGAVETDRLIAFPYFRDGESEPCGFKVRDKGAKKFRTVGDMKGVSLFGQQKYGNHDRYRIIVTEGEFDALAARQMYDGKYDVVSVPAGATAVAKAFKDNYKFLDGFREIILCFDADEAGRAGIEQAADVFAGKLRVIKLDPLVGKDACDYLKAGKQREFMDLTYSAGAFTPDGVLSATDLWDRLQKDRPEAMGEYPWAPLNELTYGFRPTELVTLCAGSGLGKSSILREIVMHIKQTTDHKVGVLFMEESVERTAEGFMGIDLSEPIHLPTSSITRKDQEYKQSFDRTFGDDKLFIMDASFDTGATVDQVVSRVRFMAKAMDCKIVVLDHISILVSGGQYGDERRALDEIMTKLRTLTQDTGIVLFAVSHLKRPDGKGHEEGAVTSVAQLRGSASIAQLSDFVIGLERNGQAEDETERNTTHIRVLKNRFSGITGPAGHLLYDRHTGRLTSYTPELEEETL